MKLGFIGAGEMGGAIIRGLLNAGWKKEDIMASVRTPEKANLCSNTLGIAAYTDNRRVIMEAERLFLAVKPAQMPQVLDEIAQTKCPTKPLISMALGWSVEKIQRVLPNWPVIRIMPNTPLALGEGVTLFHFADVTSEQDRHEIMSMFDSMGKTYEISLDCFDAATAVSSSGPAFVYAFIDALSGAGEAQGLTEETARALAIQTVIGAAKMAQQEELSPAQLAQKVATPGGCTAAGMEVLVTRDLRDVVRVAIAATTRLAQEVSKE